MVTKLQRFHSVCNRKIVTERSFFEKMTAKTKGLPKKVTPFSGRLPEKERSAPQKSARHKMIAPKQKGRLAGRIEKIPPISPGFVETPRQMLYNK
ncbi:MAG: hypothetical protein IJE98_06220 [Oscillospiraceae bacterium]|nr:hypothetical protein [Oscillospiraceae bacterium]